MAQHRGNSEIAEISHTKSNSSTATKKDDIYPLARFSNLSFDSNTNDENANGNEIIVLSDSSDASTDIERLKQKDQLQKCHLNDSDHTDGDNCVTLDNHTSLQRVGSHEPTTEFMVIGKEGASFFLCIDLSNSFDSDSSSSLDEPFFQNSR